MPAKRKPLWQYLLDAGYADARSNAERLILAGLVRVNDSIIDKVGTPLKDSDHVKVSSVKPYVSRGGFKLARALDRFSLSPQAQICVDVGASTGGFTDLLLQRGAHKVYAVDVGYGELDWKLRSDARVVVMERTNVRYVQSLPDPIALVVGDLSFISLKVIYPVVSNWLVDGADVVFLVKPQFEADRGEVPEGGVVSDRTVHKRILFETIRAAEHQRLSVRGLIPSPIRGGSGNKEFLVWLKKSAIMQVLSDDDLSSWVERAVNEDIDGSPS